MTSLTFNIIYTTGTFNLLSPFILSLLNYSNFHFVLIANGCKAIEIKEMQKFCTKFPRLSFKWLPSTETIRHGEVLDFLYKKNSLEHFCFMDSDIFASGNFSEVFTTLLPKTAALFSGAPIWITPREQILPLEDVRIRGWYNQSTKNQCIGMSYFAIYNSQILSEVMEETGITFKRYNWMQVPNKYRVLLEKLGLKKKVYDTGKLLNIMLLIYEHKLINYQSDVLIHLGGISNRMHRSFSNSVPLNVLRKNLFLELPIHRAKQLDKLLQKREIIIQYFDVLIFSLINKEPFPKFPEEIVDLTHTRKLEKYTDEIIKLYKQIY